MSILRTTRCTQARVAMVVALVMGFGAASAQQTADLKISSEMRQRVAELEQELGKATVKPTPVAGLFEVTIGPTVVYMSADGRYLIQGDLMDIATKENLTTSAVRDARAATVAGFDETNLVVYAPQEVKHTITVFTDVDCPYCSRFHNEVPKLVEAGVKVRYAAFPRGGIPSKNYHRMVSVWCATDPQTAMTAAKAGRDIDAAKCPNQVKEQFQTARAMGVRGTPTMVLSDGQILPGYMPSKRLLRILAKSRASQDG